MNTEQQHISNLEEILSKITNGKERYKTSPLVSYMVNSLLHGSDPIRLMGHLMNMVEEVSKQNLELMLKQPLQPMVIKFDHESDIHQEWLQKVYMTPPVCIKPNINTDVKINKQS